MITGTFNKIPRKKNSHGYGWARTWAENLNVGINHDADPVEILYLDHGVNFGGSINLFGGFDEKLKQRVDNFLLADKVYSLDIDMPEYGNMLAKRKDCPDKDWCARVQDKCDGAQTMLSTDLDTDWLTIGDSHTAAFAPEGSMVIKTNGLTLNGMIKNNFQYVRDHMAKCNNLQGITLVFGNIDLRHHICRLGIDYRDMWIELKRFGDSLPIPVEYAVPWPIEFEGRKLPKTGYYKGQPFWGSYYERSQALAGIIETMDMISMNKIMYPNEWLMMNPEVYAKEKMEGTSSVHISPECYRRKEFDQGYVLPI
jgi:hypothetical protein|tara:strand:- start:199 stop:1131 length:933 start_codon:yes stop_codon:yes gene_type:complete